MAWRGESALWQVSGGRKLEPLWKDDALVEQMISFRLFPISLIQVCACLGVLAHVNDSSRVE